MTKFSEFNMLFFNYFLGGGAFDSAKNHKRQKPQAPTPQAPVRNRLTRQVTKAKVRIG